MKQLLDKIIELKGRANAIFPSVSGAGKSLFEYSKASDEEIAQFETKFSLVLPDYLKAYFKYFNPIKVNLMFVEFLGLEIISKNYEKFAGYDELLDNKFVPLFDADGDVLSINTKADSGKLYAYFHEDGSIQETSYTLESYLSELIKQKEEYDKKNSNC